LQSKGGILEKTVQYLIDIKLANEHLNEHIKSLKNIEIENELLRKEVSQIRSY
jgi:upstream stimulatory factor